MHAIAYRDTQTAAIVAGSSIARAPDFPHREHPAESARPARDASPDSFVPFAVATHTHPERVADAYCLAATIAQRVHGDARRNSHPGARVLTPCDLAHAAWLSLAERDAGIPTTDARICRYLRRRMRRMLRDASHAGLTGWQADGARSVDSAVAAWRAAGGGIDGDDTATLTIPCQAADPVADAEELARVTAIRDAIRAVCADATVPIQDAAIAIACLAPDSGDLPLSYADAAQACYDPDDPPFARRLRETDVAAACIRVARAAGIAVDGDDRTSAQRRLDTMRDRNIRPGPRA